VEAAGSIQQVALLPSFYLLAAVAWFCLCFLHLGHSFVVDDVGLHS